LLSVSLLVKTRDLVFQRQSSDARSCRHEKSRGHVNAVEAKSPDCQTDSAAACTNRYSPDQAADSEEQFWIAATGLASASRGRERGNRVGVEASGWWARCCHLCSHVVTSLERSGSVQVLWADQRGCGAWQATWRACSHLRSAPVRGERLQGPSYSVSGWVFAIRTACPSVGGSLRWLYGGKGSAREMHVVDIGWTGFASRLVGSLRTGLYDC
jgi:hypothetical protein